MFRVLLLQSQSRGFRFNVSRVVNTPVLLISINDDDNHLSNWLVCSLLYKKNTDKVPPNVVEVFRRNFVGELGYYTYTTKIMRFSIHNLLY